MNLPSTTSAVRWTNLLLLVLLAVALSRLAWRLVPTPERIGSGVIPEPVTINTAAAGSGPTLNDVANLHLFGQAAAPAAARRTPVDAPETRLNLSLRGLMAGGDGQSGYAIISDPRGEEGFYRVNAKLPGGANLVEIRRDRVILQRGDQYETLRLPREMADIAPVPEPGESVAPPPEEGGGAAAPARLSAYRDRLMTNPSELSRVAQIQPVMDGGTIRGYRLSPGAERELFRRAGLQSGDIVTSINGIPLDDPAMLGQVFQQLSSVDQFSLTVERGGHLEQITIDLGQP